MLSPTVRYEGIAVETGIAPAPATRYNRAYRSQADGKKLAAPEHAHCSDYRLLDYVQCYANNNPSK